MPTDLRGTSSIPLGGSRGTNLGGCAAVLQITGWALVAGRRAGGTWLRAGLFAAVEATLGIVLLLLERVVH
jgi:hypothetical protein